MNLDRVRVVIDAATDWFRSRDIGRAASLGRAAERVPLPQHPETPDCPHFLDLSALRRVLDDEFFRDGFSTYELPLMAAMLTIASDQADGVVVDLAEDVGVAGLLCAAVLGRPVLILRRTPSACAEIEQAAADNGLEVDIGRHGADGRRIADQLDGQRVRPSIVIAGLSDSKRVLRSAQPAIRSGRPVVFVPMRGDEGGLAKPTRKLLRRLGYVGYRLRPSIEMHPRQRWVGRQSAANPYWMLTPDPVDESFVNRYEWWMEELAAATPQPHLTETTTMRFRKALRAGGASHAVGRAAVAVRQTIGETTGRLIAVVVPNRSDQSSS